MMHLDILVLAINLQKNDIEFLMMLQDKKAIKIQLKLLEQYDINFVPFLQEQFFLTEKNMNNFLFTLIAMTL